MNTLHVLPRTVIGTCIHKIRAMLSINERHTDALGKRSRIFLPHPSRLHETTPRRHMHIQRIEVLTIDNHTPQHFQRIFSVKRGIIATPGKHTLRLQGHFLLDVPFQPRYNFIQQELQVQLDPSCDYTITIHGEHRCFILEKIAR